MFQALLLLFLAVPLNAESTGGAYSLENQGIAPGGESSSGIYQSHTALQALAGAVETGPNGESYLSGLLYFYNNNLYLRSLTTTQPILIRHGQEFGVPTTSNLEAVFESAILPSSLISATTVTLVSDRLGAAVGSAVPVSLVSYDPVLNKAVFGSTSAWESGSIYKVEVGTRAVDPVGSPLLASSSFTFHTQIDFAQEASLTPEGGVDESLLLTADALAGSGAILFNTDPVNNPDRVAPWKIAAATAKSRSNNGQEAIPVSIRELNAYDSAGNPVSTSFAKPVLLRVSYRDTDDNGLVDTAAAPTRARRLGLWMLDEDNALWVRVPGSSVDTAHHQVTAPLQHFSVYALLATPDTNVSEAYAFPVPWRPFGPDPARYGTLAGGITFVNLPQVGSIKIYTLSGMLVREQPVDGSIKWVWDGRNKSGAAVASGTYLWLIEADGNRKTGKLMVIR